MELSVSSEIITLEAANRICHTTLEYGRARTMAPLAVAVLDSRGVLKSYQAEEGTSLLRFEIAFGKAWGALGMGFGGREFARRSSKAPTFINALQMMSGGRVVPVPGGLLIRNQARVIIGAVGVSGDVSENDEACAIAAIAELGLSADTGDP